MSDSVRPYPWDSPGKNTGVGCHFLLQCIKVKSESEVAQSCLTLCDPIDCSLPGSSVHGILQARALEWGAIAFSSTSLNIPLISVCKARPGYMCNALHFQSWCCWSHILLLVPSKPALPDLHRSFQNPALLGHVRVRVCLGSEFEAQSVVAF